MALESFRELKLELGLPLWNNNCGRSCRRLWSWRSVAQAGRKESFVESKPREEWYLVGRWASRKGNLLGSKLHRK